MWDVKLIINGCGDYDASAENVVKLRRRIEKGDPVVGVRFLVNVTL